MYETKKVIEVLGQFHGVKASTCTGGTSFRVNQQTLSSRVQVVIGTPGCILNLLPTVADPGKYNGGGGGA
jgi:translation initiation factor 4A